MKCIKFSFLIVLFSIVACNPTPSQEVNSKEISTEDVKEEEDVALEPENDAPESYEKGGISISPLQDYQKFPESSLSLIAPKDRSVSEVEKVDFDFAVKNYELGTQTSDAEKLGLANSDGGQHIHLILDNAPYSAHYDNKFSKEVALGHHYAIAFLSRSYHLSVKNPEAYRAFQFTVKEKAVGDPKLYRLDEPTLFYSRPKGTYEGVDTRKILLDFYLHNVELSPDGYSVLVKVNDSLDFEFDEWKPYVIEGLPMGKNTVSIELLDAQGRPVKPAINYVKREITLKP